MNLKFIHSEKATKFCEICTNYLSYVLPVEELVDISQNFVAFLEYMNFTTYLKAPVSKSGLPTFSTLIARYDGLVSRRSLQINASDNQKSQYGNSCYNGCHNHGLVIVFTSRAVITQRSGT